MRRVSLAAAAGVLLLSALVLAAGAHDVRAWRAGLAAGDLRLQASPMDARWSARTWLPRSVTRRLLTLDDDLALRRAVRAFRIAEATPRGFDNGETRGRARSAAEVALSDVAAHAAPVEASQAANLLGILVASGGRVTGGESGDDRARAEFEAALRADPTNVDAKYNLELLLRRTRATATREGPGTGSGSRGSGRRGAGSGTPGRGY